jgi:teichuronic acid exporter
VSRAELKKKAFSGFLWSFADKVGSQLAGFLITLLLARMLAPEDFGLVAMATVFYAIARVLIDGGLRDSLIQQKESSQVDYNTVFFFNATAGTFIYVLVFFLAPFIADFYGYPQLVLIIRVLGINILVYAFVIVQVATLTKKLQFKSLLKVSLPATLISGILGLAAAWMGWGIWALIAQMVLESVLYSVLLWIVVRWMPTREFDWKIFRFHWKHGSRLVLVDLLTVIYKNIYALVIGKYFSAAQLGFYNRADSFKVFTYNNTIGLIQNVSYPVLAQVQDDNAMLKKTYRRILQGTFLVVLSICVLLITLAEPIISFLLTDKWLPAAPILMVLTLVNVLAPFNTISINILKVKRRTDLLMRVELINKIILVIVVIASVMLGFQYLIWSAVFLSFLAIFIYNYYSNKLISYAIGEQLKDLLPMLIAFVISCGLTFAFVRYVKFDMPFLLLVSGSFVALGSYILVIFAVDRAQLLSMVELFTVQLKGQWLNRNNSKTIDPVSVDNNE